jgi:hypothetical protein
MKKVRVIRFYGTYLRQVLKEGSVRGIPVNAGLYFSRNKELAEIVKVEPVRHNEFRISLGRNGFKPLGDYGRYSYFLVSGKKWRI